MADSNKPKINMNDYEAQAVLYYLLSTALAIPNNGVANGIVANTYPNSIKTLLDTSNSNINKAMDMLIEFAKSKSPKTPEEVLQEMNATYIKLFDKDEGVSPLERDYRNIKDPEKKSEQLLEKYQSDASTSQDDYRNYTGQGDHVAAELLYMSSLYKRISFFYKNEQLDYAENELRKANNFKENRISKWIEPFANAVTELDISDFYTAIAQITAIVVTQEEYKRTE